MHKKILLTFVILLAFSVGLAAAQETDLSKVDPSKQTIVYWNQFTGDPQKAAMAGLIDDFNKTNEWGITVQNPVNASYNDIQNQMTTAITSGELPNLVAGYTNAAAGWAKDDVVVDLNTYYNDAKWGFSDDDKADFKKGVLDTGLAPDGTRLAWPNVISARVMVVNMTMAKALGVDNPPETFDDFQKLACAASKTTGPKGEKIQGFGISVDASEFESFLAGRGGTIYHDGKFDFTSPEVTATFQMYHDLFSQGCAYVATDSNRPFGNTDDFALGLNVMASTSTAGLPFIQSGFNKAGITADWVLTTTPWTEGNRAIQLFAPSLIMIRSTPEKQLATWLFIKYLSAADKQAQWSTSTLYFTTRTSSDKMLGDKAMKDPYFGKATELINDKDMHIYASPGISAYTQVRSLIADAVVAVTSGGKSVDEVTKKLQSDADAIEQ